MSQEKKKCNKDNCFHAISQNGEEHDSHGHKWSDISVRKIVKRNGEDYHVHVCKHPLKSLEVNYAGMTQTLECGEGEELYQAIRGRVVLTHEKKHDLEVGRVIGKVKDNKICEEYLLDGIIKKVIPTQVVDN
jgi:hypothetical protein